MPVRVTEYLGHSTAQAGATITPATKGAQCPFANGVPCKKIENDGKPPVCSVRKHSRGMDGMLWIVCSKRLCASQHDISLSPYQSDMLFAIARLLYGDRITKGDILIKSEEQIKFRVPDAKPYRADFTFQISDPTKATLNGQPRFIVEMQGGGETSNTKLLTSGVVGAWETSAHRSNADLAKTATDVGTLETNAWRRQQEQLLVKGSAAKTTGNCGMALCIGQALYAYVVKKIDPAKIQGISKTPPHDAWSLAIIPIVETDANDPDGINVGDSLALKPDATKTLYLDYDEFVHLLVSQGGNSSEAFMGECLDLNGATHTIP